MKPLGISLVALCLFAQGENTPNGDFTVTSGVGWLSNHSFELGIEQKILPGVGLNVARRDFPIPVFPKTLTYSGTLSFGPHIPDHKLYASANLVRMWILPCGPGHGSLGEQESYMIFNANMNRVFDRGETTWNNITVGPFPPPCSDGSPMILRVMMAVAAAGDKTACELELFGRWE